MFMREGKLAGAAWQLFEDNPPDVVNAHLDALRTFVSPSTLGWMQEDVELLDATYLAAARKMRVCEAALGAMNQLHPLELERRLTDAQIELERRLVETHAEANAHAAERETRRSSPSAEARALATRIGTTPESRVTIDELRVLYREIGRLSGPLWIAGTAEDFPSSPDAAINVLKLALADRLEPERMFDEASSRFVLLGYEEKHDELVRCLVDAMFQERKAYFADYPMQDRKSVV